jgi:hypothetical protein
MLGMSWVSIGSPVSRDTSWSEEEVTLSVTFQPAWSIFGVSASRPRIRLSTLEECMLPSNQPFQQYKIKEWKGTYESRTLERLDGRRKDDGKKKTRQEMKNIRSEIFTFRRRSTVFKPAASQTRLMHSLEHQQKISVQFFVQTRSDAKIKRTQRWVLTLQWGSVWGSRGTSSKRSLPNNRCTAQTQKESRRSTSLNWDQSAFSKYRL